MADVLLLYGVAERDDQELVAMFFANREDLEEFRESLPGRYQIMGVDGVDYDRLEIVSVEVEVEGLDDPDAEICPYPNCREISRDISDHFAHMADHAEREAKTEALLAEIFGEASDG